jgi:hypothetical protein
MPVKSSDGAITAKKCLLRGLIDVGNKLNVREA